LTFYFFSQNPCVWNEIPDLSFKFVNFEELFALKEYDGTCTPRRSVTKIKPGKTRVIDDKRSRQFAIMLGRFPSLEILKEAIEKCDFTILNPERVSMMNEMVSF
jgi:hypothetical protein